MPKSALYFELSPLWYKTGVQDYYNVGNAEDIASDAGVDDDDDRDEVRRKIKEVIMESADLDAQVIAPLLPAEREALTLGEKRSLLNDWARGWADSATQDYIEWRGRRARDDED